MARLMLRLLPSCLLAGLCTVSLAAEPPEREAPPPAVTGLPAGSQPLLADPPAAEVVLEAVDPESAAQHHNFLSAGVSYRTDTDAYSIVSVARGLSTHKPMYVLPITYGRGIEGLDTEAVFQISAKQRLFGTNLYFGYTQKSFWQIYDEDRSRPFRETNYNPELFYRITPDPERWHHWGLDIGFEHDSNGNDLPDSRSWNRLYIAPFQAKGSTLRYLKIWYRIPESDDKDADDPKRDDNPHIHRYMGYAELQLQRQLSRGALIHARLRGNTSTGKGAIGIDYTWPSSSGHIFYMAQFFHGYGESLIDYDRSITRFGLGFALTR